MKEWLESVANTLQDGVAGNKLASALCVTHCLTKIGIQNLKIDRFALPLVEMLYLTPNLEKKDCPNYIYLCVFLKDTGHLYGHMCLWIFYLPACT